MELNVDVCHVYAGTHGGQRGHQIIWSWIYRGLQATQHRYWELSPGLQKEHQSSSLDGWDLSLITNKISKVSIENPKLTTLIMMKI